MSPTVHRAPAGLLRAAPAVGALATSLVLAHHPLERRIGPILFGSVMASGAATVVCGVSISRVVSLAAPAVLGAADVVSAAHSLFTGTSNQLGAFESGVAADVERERRMSAFRERCDRCQDGRRSTTRTGESSPPCPPINR